MSEVRYPPEYYGKAMVSKDGKTRKIINNQGIAVLDETYVPQAPKAKTSGADARQLEEALKRSQVERDALRQYQAAEKAVKTYDPSPAKNFYHDMIYPEPNGDWMDTVGAVLGTPLRWLVSNETEQARDHLKTIEAAGSIEASTALKGPATDKDMALIRQTNVTPGKTLEENMRLVNDSKYQSGLEQVRSNVLAMWLNKYGSLSAPSRSGKSYPEILKIAEDDYAKRYRAKTQGKKLPKAPPKGRGRGTVTIDINGNPIK